MKHDQEFEDIRQLCYDTAKALFKMYPDNPDNPDNPDGKLVFPFYRDNEKKVNTKRVSEQEARFTFVNELIKQEKYFYSVETPTNYRYSKFSTGKPEVDKNNSGNGRSGCIDLTLYTTKTPDKRLCNIEFKSKLPETPSITKDVLKLVFEDHRIGVFFHLLEHSKSNTLDTLNEKLNESIKYVIGEKKPAENKDSANNDKLLFFFIVVLGKKGSNYSSIYLEELIKISDLHLVNFDDFKKTRLH